MTRTASATQALSIVRLMVAGTLLACSPPAAGAPPRAAGKPDLQASDLEQRIHALVNRERVAKKVPRLQGDAKLSKIARAHSADMVRRKYFSHVDPDGGDPSDRGRRAGFECRRQSGRSVMRGLAENIYQNTTYERVTYRNGVASYDWSTAEEIAASTVRGWMKSRGHRKNILRLGPTLTGVGVAISPDGKVLVTQVFC
jgi:uncharacterized protein YkwD